MSAAWISDSVAQRIQVIRKGGKCNMADRKRVQIEADALGFHDVVIVLEEHPEAYLRYILTGSRS